MMAKAILRAANDSVPRGAHKEYIPNWSAELERLHQDIIAARGRAENEPSVENNILFKKASAKYVKATTNTNARKSWQEKTSNLNLERDGQKLWKLVRSLNGEYGNRQSPLVIEKEGEMLGGKAAANALISHYKSVGNIELPEEKIQEINQANRDNENPVSEPIDSCLDSKLRILELEKALAQLKNKQAPGPDKVSNDMLKHLRSQAKKKLLQLFNASWKTSNIPKTWKKAITIPILKCGNCRTRAESYRPISLTSSVCKLMGRIVNTRLMWLLEKDKLLMPEQAGFRQLRSAEDQTCIYLPNDRGRLPGKKHTVAVWIDMEKAFDKVWTEGLVNKLNNINISHKMLHWIKNYLRNRQALVKTNEIRSKTENLQNGVPHGGVLSPTLFLIFINDIQKQISKKVYTSLYADDLAPLCTEEELGTAKIRLQTTLNGISKRASDWGLSVNNSKTTYTVFTLSTKKCNVKIEMNGWSLQKDYTRTYLGVTFGSRLTWKKNKPRNV